MIISSSPEPELSEEPALPATLSSTLIAKSPVIIEPSISTPAADSVPTPLRVTSPVPVIVIDSNSAALIAPSAWSASKPKLRFPSAFTVSSKVIITSPVAASMLIVSAPSAVRALISKSALAMIFKV